MILKKLKTEARLNLILFLMALVVLSGIFFVLKNIEPETLYRQITLLVMVATLWISLILFIRIYFRRHFSKPLEKISKVSLQASRGDLSVKSNIREEGEIGEISTNLDNIIRNQLNLSVFADKLGEGDFDAEYELLSENDRAGASFTGMRDKLKKLAHEDQARNWVSAGLSQFNEILREDDVELSILCDRFLSNLVKYLRGNQGMIFLLQQDEQEEKVLELMSAYAWSRKKYLTRTIALGEGLIGQAAIEKEKIYVKDTPEEYISITSGLGDANPRCILIVPMISNDEMFGVIELASFNEFETHEIEFVEKLAEILASTISRLNTNEQTQKLLRDSQKLTEELRAQEEEMRQNLEEMNATQEEMQQREVERIGIFTAINNTLATLEFDMEGRIINANSKFLEMMGYSFEEIEHKNDRIFADKLNESIEVFNNFWKELKEGKVQSGDYKRVTKTGREIWVNASYTPALNKEGAPYKVIALATDITEKKNAELETQRQAEELRLQGEKMKAYTTELEDIKQNLSEKLNEASMGLKKKIMDIEAEKAKNIAVLEGCVDGVISFDHRGLIEYFNTAAEEIWGLQREKVIGKNISSIIAPLRLEQNNGSLDAYYVNGESKKAVDVRTEMSWTSEEGKEFDLLVTLTRAKVNDNMTFTIFAQKISVDLF